MLLGFKYLGGNIIKNFQRREGDKMVETIELNKFNRIIELLEKISKQLEANGVLINKNE